MSGTHISLAHNKTCTLSLSLGNVHCDPKEAPSKKFTHSLDTINVMLSTII